MAKYYKTGEFAKMANLSIRTIRYYDKLGLLKPSRVEDNGYRMYSDQDFIKLQKILSLKSLGFSLDEIMSMTVNDSYVSLQKSLTMQKKMIDNKIENLLNIKSSLIQIEEYLKNNTEMDWKKILESIHFTNMEKDLVQQYKDSTNVDIRIRLHEKYSVNPHPWFQWLYSHYELKKGYNVLELGCGNGKLWQVNGVEDIHLILSDVSSGMLEDAKENLKEYKRIEYNCFDCHYIPYDNESFDIIIANHLLFYVNDIDSVLNEITRVLKPTGILYCSTYGSKHMKEITDIIKEYNPKITLSNINLYEVFGLDNGKDILSKHFKDIDLIIHDDYLLVDNSDDITNYILSCHGNQIEYILKDSESFKRFINKKVKKTIKITKEAGMFVCKK